MQELFLGSQKFVPNSENNMSWSTMSNAADRSRRVSTETLPVSIAVKKSLATFKRAVSVTVSVN